MKFLTKVSASGVGFSFVANEIIDIDYEKAKSMIQAGFLIPYEKENALNKNIEKAEKTKRK